MTDLRQFETLLVDFNNCGPQHYGGLEGDGNFKAGDVVHVYDGGEDEAMAIVDRVEDGLVYVDVIWPTFDRLDRFQYDATTKRWWVKS